MKETRVLITKMRLLLFLLVAVLAIGCQKDEISTTSVVVTEEIHEDGDGHIGMDHISGDKIPKIMNLVLPGVDIPAKTSDVATAFGQLAINDILKTIDSLDNETYSFHIMPTIAKPNSVFNLVVKPPSLNSEQSISIVEYRMTEQFAEGYYNGSKTFEDFSGNVITYPYSPESDILQRDVCIQNIDEVVNCSLVTVNPSNGGGATNGSGNLSTTIGDTVVYFGNDGNNVGSGSGGGSSTGHALLSWVCSCGLSHGSPSECHCTNTSGGQGAWGASGNWNLRIIVPPLDSSHSSGGKSKASCCDDSNISGSPAGVNLLSEMIDYIDNCVPVDIGGFSFLANSPATFGIKSYIDNNGCNSETKAVIDAILNFGAANRSTPEGRQIADFIIAGLLNNLNTSKINNTEALDILSLANSTELIAEARLTIAVEFSTDPWINSNGKIDGKSQFAYNAYRDHSFPDGQQARIFRLNNGDKISRGNYAIGAYSIESENRTYYYSNSLNLWFEYLKPSTDCLSCSLQHIFAQSGLELLKLTGRYAIPVEDGVILVTGRDFDGDESSKAVAGTFLLVDVFTAGTVGKLLKITKKVGQGLDATATVIKQADNLYKNQKRIVDKIKKGLVSLSNSNRKGNFGEMVTDSDFYEKGYDILHTRIQNIDQCPGCSGIDHVFKNSKTGEYIIVESKFGTSTLSTLADGTKQMSNKWILDRLSKAVGNDFALFTDIINKGYQRVISKVDVDGNVVYKLVGSNGNVLNTIFKP